MMSLDSGLNESYVQILEDWKKLEISYHTIISHFQTIVGQNDFQ